MLIYWRVYIYNYIYIHKLFPHWERCALRRTLLGPGILPDFCSSRRKPPSLWVLSRCPHWATLPKAEKWRKFAALPCPARLIRCWRADSIKYQQQHMYLTIVFHVSFINFWQKSTIHWPLKYLPATPLARCAISACHPACFPRRGFFRVIWVMGPLRSSAGYGVHPS